MWTDDDVELFATAHAETAVQASSAEDLATDLGVPASDLAALISGEMRERLESEAREFCADHGADLQRWLAPDHAGYDLWMTRAGEGTGYWARYLPNDPGDVFSRYALSVRRDPDKVAEFDAAMRRLTDAAKALGELEPYAGDDGRIHV